MEIMNCSYYSLKGTRYFISLDLPYENFHIIQGISKVFILELTKVKSKIHVAFDNNPDMLGQPCLDSNEIIV